MISLLLKEMLKKFSLTNKKISISPEIKANIKIIQSICDTEYYNQSFYGSAALNRKILLDKRIADLLTPETILGILYYHHETTHLDKNSEIAIRRNSSGYISLAAALFYGFEEGLDTIELMPNNESHYNSKKYQEQKEQFKENTNRIITHIKHAAALLEIPFKTEEPKEEQPLLTQLFQSIEQTISKIKHHKKSDELLYVPTYTPDNIRRQSLHGFTTICQILKIPYKTDPQGAIIIDASITMEEFIKKFLFSEEALLNGTVIHLFYDRAHLEACIEQNTKIIFQNKEYYLRDILKSMVETCETDPSISRTAKEQFGIRLKLCDMHLKRVFPDYYQTKNNQPKIEDNMPVGYRQIKKWILNIDAEIDKSLWVCKDLEKLYAEKKFLSGIIDFYDHAEGKLPLKKCLVLSKWQHPEGYQEAFNKKGVALFFNILNEKSDQNPTQGARLKNNASKALEKLLHALLHDYKTINCSYNVLNELELSIDDDYFNVTQILLHDPDFEHIEFTDKQLAFYADFAINKASNKPIIAFNNKRVIPTADDYTKSDKALTHLDYAEKLAIIIYSSHFYSEIQNFLRTCGQSQYLRNTISKDNLNYLVPEILLSTAIAAHGLAKPANNIKAQSRVYRKETGDKNSNFFVRRLETMKKKLSLFERGFLSTSSNNSYKKPSANTYTVFHEESHSSTIGKNIEGIAQYSDESEILYGPGTQLQYTDYHREGNLHFFAVKPMRSIDGIKPDHYSNMMLAKHELEIIDKMFELHLIKNKHSRFRRLFDTVSNDDKLACVQKAKIEINNIVKNMQPNKKLNSNCLQLCKDAIESAIEKNEILVSTAYWHASLGKTDTVLQEALVRVSRAINLLSHDETLMVHDESGNIPSNNTP